MFERPRTSIVKKLIWLALGAAVGFFCIYGYDKWHENTGSQFSQEFIRTWLTTEKPTADFITFPIETLHELKEQLNSLGALKNTSVLEADSTLSYNQKTGLKRKAFVIVLGEFEKKEGIFIAHLVRQNNRWKISELTLSEKSLPALKPLD